VVVREIKREIKREFERGEGKRGHAGARGRQRDKNSRCERERRREVGRERTKKREVGQRDKRLEAFESSLKTCCSWIVFDKDSCSPWETPRKTRVFVFPLGVFGKDFVVFTKSLCLSAYRVAKTHRIPYLYRSFSAKVTYI